MTKNYILLLDMMVYGSYSYSKTMNDLHLDPSNP